MKKIKIDIVLKSGLIGVIAGIILFLIWVLTGSKEVFLFMTSLLTSADIFYNNFLNISTKYLTLKSSLNLFLAISLVVEGFIIGCIIGIIIKYTRKRK